MKELKLLMLPSLVNIDEISSGISFPMKVTKAKYSELEFRFKSNGVELLHNFVDIRQFSYIWISSNWNTRDLAYSVSLYCDYYKIPHTFVEQASSKITDQLMFALNSMSIPNSYYIENQDISAYADEIEKTCNYPIIIKDIKGSKGKYSVLCNNREELLTKTVKLPKSGKYFFQQYIQNEYDWGVLVANGEVVATEKRFPKTGEFRNNVCNGSTEIFINIDETPDNVKEIALKASNLLNLTWSRSDILIDKNTGAPYLLEVNRFPGITPGTTEVTGAQKFLTSIYEKI